MVNLEKILKELRGQLAAVKASIQVLERLAAGTRLQAAAKAQDAMRRRGRAAAGNSRTGAGKGA